MSMPESKGRNTPPPVPKQNFSPPPPKRQPPPPPQYTQQVPPTTGNTHKSFYRKGYLSNSQNFPTGVRVTTNTEGIWSLLLSMVGVFLFSIPLVSLIINLIALILSIIGLSKNSHGAAIVGLFLSIINLFRLLSPFFDFLKLLS